MIDPELRDIIECELAEGEELLWTGRPQNHPNLIFSVGGLIFTVFWFLGLSILLAGWLNMFPSPLNYITPIFLIFLSGLALFGIYFLATNLRQILSPKTHIYGLSNSSAIIIDRFSRGRKLVIKDPEIVERLEDATTQSIRFKNPTAKYTFDIKKHKRTLWGKLPPVFFNVSIPNQILADIARKAETP